MQEKYFFFRPTFLESQLLLSGCLSVSGVATSITWPHISYYELGKYEYKTNTNTGKNTNTNENTNTKKVQSLYDQG